MTVPGVGLNCYYSCLLQGRSDDEIEYCVRTRCGGVKTENGEEVNADGSEVLISEAKVPHPDIVKFQCYYTCYIRGRNDDEVEDCIRAKCDKGNLDDSDVRISENASTAQISSECYSDCARRFPYNGRPERNDARGQCFLDCVSGKEGSNLRGSIK